MYPAKFLTQRYQILKRTKLFRLIRIVFGIALICPVPSNFAQEIYTHSWALLVGVSDYALSQNPDRQYAIDDVEAVKNALYGLGFPKENVFTLKNAAATKAGILSYLDRFADQSIVGENDRVLIYFSCYAQTVRQPRGGEMGYLLPYDAQAKLSDIDDIGAYNNTAIRMDEVIRYINRFPAKHVLVVLDACLSGLASEQSRDLTLVSSLNAAANNPARQFITAGFAGQQVITDAAWRHGAFTYAFLRALTDFSADANRDGYTTGAELAVYLMGEVPALTDNRQTPQLVNYGGDGQFVFAHSAKQKTAGATDTERPILAIVEPSEFAHGARRMSVKPLGETVRIVGHASDNIGVTQIIIDGDEISFKPALITRRMSIHPLYEATTVEFETEINVLQGDERRIEIKTNDAAGNVAQTTVQLHAEAPDTQKPELRILDPARRGTGLILPPSGIRVYGIARDDRSVLEVTVNNRPVNTRTASTDELSALPGWEGSVIFETHVLGRNLTEIVIAATDAAGNQTVKKIPLKTKVPSFSRPPEIRIIEPEKSRGTGLLLPSTQKTVKIIGFARSIDSQIREVRVGDLRPEVEPAAQTDKEKMNWVKGHVLRFETSYPVPNGTAALLEIAVTAIDEVGLEETVSVRVRPTGVPLRATITPDRLQYRFGERIHYRMQVNQDAYCYVLQTDLDGKISLFRPNRVEPDPLLRPNQVYRFPSPDQEARYPGQYGMVAQAPAGRDTVWLIALPKPLPATKLNELTNFVDVVELLGNVEGAGEKVQPILSVDELRRKIRELAEMLDGTVAEAQYEVVEQ